MKKYRSWKAGFIVMYVLGILCVGDALFTLINQVRGTSNEFMQSFSLFSYMIAILAVLYVRMYGSTRIEIDATHMRVVWPVYIRPKQGEKRAMFIYRQGDLDMKLMNKRFDLRELAKFGYIEDLGYERLDKSGVRKLAERKAYMDDANSSGRCRRAGCRRLCSGWTCSAP